MQIRQCDFCRMPYQSMGKNICADCLLKLDEEFIEIREYLWEHENAGMDEVIEATGISRKSIMYLLKEERLIVGDKDKPGSSILTCESCKKPISTGKMCDDCKKEVVTAMHESLGGVVSKPRRRPEPVDEETKRGVAKIQVKGK